MGLLQRATASSSLLPGDRCRSSTDHPPSQPSVVYEAGILPPSALVVCILWELLPVHDHIVVVVVSFIVFTVKEIVNVLGEDDQIELTIAFEFGRKRVEEV